MSLSPFVFDASAENYRSLVMENSDKGPVLVNYWSPRAGPCLMLMPRLVRLATEFGGRFLLVMLNTDELGQLAREHGVASLPTLKVFRRGQVVDTLHGAESETVLREFITRHVERESEARHATAILAYQRDNLDQAVTQAAEAALVEPDNQRLALDLVKLLVLQRRYAQADELLKSLPAETREFPEVRHLSAHVNLIRSALDAPPLETLIETVAVDPDDLEARYRLSAVMLTRDEYESSMEQLLEIIRRDGAFRDRAGFNGLHAIFSLLGENDERVRRYRTLLSQIAS